MIRNLKVELAGDYFYGKTVPKIRLQGRWLAALGFQPNGRVTVRPLASGELILTFKPSPPTYVQ